MNKSVLIWKNLGVWWISMSIGSFPTKKNKRTLVKRNEDWRNSSQILVIAVRCP